MIEVEGLSKHYGAHAAVSELSFAVGPGELLGLVGPNGAGKTTTLRCLSGIIPATRGTVRIGGHDLGRDPLAAKRQLAFLADEPRLFEYLTVRQHLQFIGRLYQIPDAVERGEVLLERLELTAKGDSLPGELSRGMKQKAALACGLLHSPRVLFFDEPLTGLDPIAIRRMKDLIQGLARDGASLVLSSHLLPLLEELCTHLLILKQGRRIAHGTIAEVRARFTGNRAGASLEEAFLRAAGDPGDLPPVA